VKLRFFVSTIPNAEPITFGGACLSSTAMLGRRCRSRNTATGPGSMSPSSLQGQATTRAAESPSAPDACFQLFNHNDIWGIDL
jgi:hypothetical protein